MVRRTVSIALLLAAIASAACTSSDGDDQARCLGGDGSTVCAHLVDDSRWEIRAEGLESGSVLDLRSPALGQQRYTIGSDGRIQGTVGLIAATFGPTSGFSGASAPDGGADAPQNG